MRLLSAGAGTEGPDRRALESIGYRLREAVDPRDNTAHRFVRGDSKVDLVASAEAEIVDVLRADHPAPTAVETLVHPGVHGPDGMGGNRRRPEPGFTLRTAVPA